MTARDWRQPLAVLATEPSNDVTVGIVNGRAVLRRGVSVTYDRESTERIRSGYACARCQQVFEVAWPQSCWFCGAAVRERQAEYFAREYGGEIDMRPTDWSDEIAAIDEHKRKEEESNGKPSRP